MLENLETSIRRSVLQDPSLAAVPFAQSVIGSLKSWS